MLVATDIYKSYSGVPVLHGVSLSVPRHSVSVVMGPSGGGKSTLVRCLSLLDKPDKGSVELNGRCVYPCPPNTTQSVWPSVTVVFQQLFLWPHLRLRENISLPATLRGLPLSNMTELCASLSIDHLLDRYPNEVSVGQRQRAALARALMLRPQYLLLDEVTSALDVEQIYRLLGVLRNAIASGTGLILVTHHVGFARLLMEEGENAQFLFLEDGSVVEAGGTDTMAKPRSDRVRQFMRALETIG